MSVHFYSGNQIMETESSALRIMRGKIHHCWMGGVCRINGNNYTTQSAKKCQGGKATGHGKKGMDEWRPKHVGG
jgi:hypothetical protein